MSTQPLLSPTLFTMAEYLTFERAAEERHEYLDGLIYDMAGESEAYGIITVNLTTAFTNQLRGTGCRAVTKDMKVQCGPYNAYSRKGLYAYPDVLIVCGERRFHDHVRDVLLNPVLIAEILSPSTAAYDRAQKFDLYAAHLPGLMDYLLVHQDCPRLDHYHRTAPQAWDLTKSEGLSSELTLPVLGCRVILADIYDGVTFPA